MLKKLSSLILTIGLTGICGADTIANYQHISQAITKMEIKADEQSQAWARSARNVLTITNESIAETLIALNNKASDQGMPFFCLPSNQKLNAALLGEILKEAEKDAPSGNHDNMTVSQVALGAVMKKFPCHTKKQNAYSSLMQTKSAMQHAQAD